MAKTSKAQVVKDETKVLTQLAKNSKESIETIAKQVGFSRQKVWRIVKQLESDGMIWGYTIVADQHKQGLKKFILTITRSMQHVDKKTVESMAAMSYEKVYQELGVTILSSYYVHGEYDWVVVFSAPSLLTAIKYKELLAKNHQAIVKKMTICEVLYTQKEQNIRNPDFKKLTELL